MFSNAVTKSNFMEISYRRQAYSNGNVIWLLGDDVREYLEGVLQKLLRLIVSHPAHDAKGKGAYNGQCGIPVYFRARGSSWAALSQSNEFIFFKETHVLIQRAKENCNG